MPSVERVLNMKDLKVRSYKVRSPSMNIVISVVSSFIII